MKLSDETLKNFFDEIRKLYSENRYFKHGWIQSFLEINGDKCKICGRNKLVSFPYPSLNTIFRYEYCIGCCSCGVSYINNKHIDLNKYYEIQYATQDRKDRDIEPEIYFSSENYLNGLLSKYFNRVNRHLNYIKNIFNKDIIDVLDFGSGPGYFLYSTNAKNKFAIEPDPYCKKYLDYINCIQINMKTILNYKFDLIYSSHSLEHLFIDDLATTTTTFCNQLKDDGIFFIEVPCGNILRHKIVVKHEPHTIFFTPESIELLLKLSGFKSINIFLNSYKLSSIRKDFKYCPTGKYLDNLDFISAICCIASKIENDERIYNTK